MCRWLSLLGILGWLLSPVSAQTLQDLQGQSRSVQELLAQPGTEALLLVVWCSHCGSCRTGERELARYAQQSPPGLKVLALSPHPADTPDKIRRFLSGQGLSLEVVRDRQQALVRRLGITRTTTAILYDRRGQVRYLGPFQGDGAGFASDAAQQLLAGREVTMSTRPQKGCPLPIKP